MNLNVRIWILFSALVCFSFLLVGRLYWIQIISGQEFVQLAENQFVVPNYHNYSRGDIVFSTVKGERVPMATLRSGNILALNPLLIIDPEYVYKELSSVIDVDKERFDVVTSREVNYVELNNHLSLDEGQAIRKLELEGVTLHPQSWRYYPGESIAAQTVGFIGFQGNELAGRYGLERNYESVLSRRSDSYTVNFFAEIFANMSHEMSDMSHVEGDVITYLEPSLQSMVENRLLEFMDKWHAEEVGAIVMDPVTGSIFSFSSLPSFDPNDFRNAKPDRYANPLVENVYEMGSVIKALTIASGIDAGVISPQSKYYDHGSVRIDGFTVSNFDGRSRGEIDMQKVLNDSVNTGVVHIMELMGTNRFAQYMKDFGFSEKTGIDLPNEAENIINNFDSPRRIEYATASFGQGIALTPIGTIRALSALANGGLVVEPRLVERIEYSDGTIEEIEKPNPRRVISEESSRSITRMLVNTVDEALVGGSFKKDRYSIAAKTGTAQVAHKFERGYQDDVFLHSFFGYFPAYDPEFIIFLYAVNPKDSLYASQTLTEPFIDITNFIINHYSISPDR